MRTVAAFAAVAALLAFGRADAAPSFVGFAGGAYIQGPEAATINVPDVIGDNEATATTTIEAASLVVGTVFTACSTTTAGLVISTAPSAGTLVADSASVDLYLSTGDPCRGKSGVHFPHFRMPGF